MADNEDTFQEWLKVFKTQEQTPENLRAAYDSAWDDGYDKGYDNGSEVYTPYP